LRTRSSHHIYGKEGRRERISVPVHAGKDLKPGLLAFFLKQAELTEKDI
jgi:predicted RNA binding protein YcfA (HicA-like mRNA interferase family)